MISPWWRTDGLTMVAPRLVADALFDMSVAKRLALPESATEDAVQAHRSKHVEYWVGLTVLSARSESP